MEEQTLLIIVGLVTLATLVVIAFWVGYSRGFKGMVEVLAQIDNNPALLTSMEVFAKSAPHSLVEWALTGLRLSKLLTRDAHVQQVITLLMSITTKVTDGLPNTGKEQPHA